jgi:hypothetical protein
VFRAIALFDGRVEGVRIDVQDREFPVCHRLLPPLSIDAVAR